MSLDTTPITEVDAFTAQIFPPQSGTTELAADVKALAQVAGNRTKNLNGHKTNKVMVSGEQLVVSLGAAIVEQPPQRPVDAATINFDWASGPDIVLPSPSGLHNCVVYDATSTIPPTNGMRVIVRTVPGMGTGVSWVVKREGGTIIAKLGTEDQLTAAGMGTTTDWSGGAATTWPSGVILKYEAGVWRGVAFWGFVQMGVGW